MNNFQKLQKFMTTQRRNSKVYKSIYQLLEYGTTTTGESGVRRGHWMYKQIWTSEVSKILTSLGIKHICGNSAPRGGASGEYVTIKSPAFMKIVKEHQEEQRKLKEEQEKIEREKREIRERQREEHFKRLAELVEKNISIIWTSIRKNQIDISRYNYMSRREEKDFAKIVSEASSVDYQVCLYFARHPRFIRSQLEWEEKVKKMEEDFEEEVKQKVLPSEVIDQAIQDMIRHA